MDTELHNQLQSALSETYVIERELGGGGMSRVFLATEVSLGRRVVVKVLPPEMSGALSAERFRREILMAAQLRHPLIVPVLAAGKAGELLYYTMPYIEGESLGARLARQGELPLADAVRVLQDALEALAYAHRHATTHRDIKPDNLLLDSASGHTLVADFGVAKALGAAGTRTDALTTAGLAVGTAAYMAPEMVSADPNADHRADLYSLGIVAYELLAGSHPFAGRPPQALLAAHATEAPEPLSRRRPNVPQELADLVMRLLEKRPADRAQSAEDVLRDLERITSSGQLRATRAGVPQREVPGLEWLDLGLRHTRRHAFKYGTLVTLLVVAGVAVTYRTVSEESELPSAAGTGVAAPNAKSLAVLPFVNTSSDPENEYFSDGLTDELIAALSKVAGLRVTARTSAFALKGKGLDVRTVADTLGVATVLEGTVRHAENRLKVTAQLVNAADNGILWSETYDREFKDVFALQDEIARAIVAALRVTLATGGAAAPIVKSATEDTAAYTLYLKGRYHWSQSSRDGLLRAVQYFQQAVARDTRYARAYVGLADANAMLGILGFHRPSDVLARSKAAARTALALDSTLGEAHAMLALILFAYEWQWKSSEEAFRRAIALDSNNVNTRRRFAIALADQGRFSEAIAQLDATRASDPLHAQVLNILGRVYVNARQPDQAIKALSDALELAPNLDMAYQQLGHAYLQKGMPVEAIATFRRAALSGVRDSAHLAYAYAVTGARDEAAALLRKLVDSSSERYVPPFHIAVAYAGLGDADEAFRWLDRAYAEQASFMDGINVTPAFDRLRADPRFLRLLQRMGLAR